VVLEQISIFGVALDEARDVRTLRYDFQFFGARPRQRGADEFFRQSFSPHFWWHESMSENHTTVFALVLGQGGHAFGMQLEALRGSGVLNRMRCCFHAGTLFIAADRASADKQRVKIANGCTRS